MKTTTITLPAEFPPHDPERNVHTEQSVNRVHAKNAADMIESAWRPIARKNPNFVKRIIVDILHLAHSEGHDPVSIIRDAVEAFTAEAGPVETEDEAHTPAETHLAFIKVLSEASIITLDGVRFIREPETPVNGWTLTIKKTEPEPWKPEVGKPATFKAIHETDDEDRDRHNGKVTVVYDAFGPLWNCENADGEKFTANSDELSAP